MERLPITVWQVCDDPARAVSLRDIVDDSRLCRAAELVARLDAGFHLPDVLLIHRWDTHIAERTRRFARVYLDRQAETEGEITVDAAADPATLARALATAQSLAVARNLALPGATRGGTSVVPLRPEAPALGDFELHYQPQWALAEALADDALIGAEALLRWHGLAVPALGPEALVADAEANGQIASLGAWVFERAAWDLVGWLAWWPPQSRLALNLSVAQLRDSGLVPRVERLLSRSGLDPALIEIELPCAAVAGLDRRQAETAAELADAGFSFALDRVGASVLERRMLERLRARTWKLDRSLVARAADDRSAALLIETLCDRARNLGIRTLAVGIETPSQQALLARLGCDGMQGFLRGEALPPRELSGLLAAHAERLAERHRSRRAARG